MCGIAGFYTANKRFSSDELRRMTAALHHRGPDAEGFFESEVCSLSHRRLSIIDLDARSNQPMYSHNGRYIMVYNGEVYNYKEIAVQLKLSNLRTTSDSEIILEAFAEKGIESFKLLNGMFAIAIFDSVEQQLIIARDRIGIKPIYFYYDGSNFAFASELKALTKLPIEKLINQGIVSYFLQLGYIPAPYSIYKNIYKAGSGCCMQISKTGIKETEYWNLSETISNDVCSDLNSAKRKLEDLLFSSIEWQLRSDVPVGVFLSGGIDSSIIAAIASKVSAKKVSTYSIGFSESSHDESQYAFNVSKLLETNHHQFKVSYRDALKLIETIPSVYDEPFGDPSAIPTMMVSQLAAKHVKVVLSGDGGDELFWGYGAYKWARRMNNPLIKLFHNQAAAMLAMLPNKYKRVSRLLNFEGRNPSPQHIFSQEQYMFNSDEAKQFLINRSKDALLQFNYATTAKRKLSAIEKQDLFDLRYYLQDDLLVKVDRASMLHSLEVRVPLLDHRIIEFAINLHGDLKIRNGESKFLLKELLYTYLPRQLFQRPKQGFAIPVTKWLQGELRPLLEKVLSKKNIQHYNVVNHTEVEKLKREFFAGRDYHYNRLWQLMILHLWLQHNLTNNN